MCAHFVGLKSRLRETSVGEMLTGFRRSRMSYSQFGEDVFLRGYYKRLAHDRGVRVSKGVFIDVGAYRPIVFSNSYVFHREGWKTINIDPAPESKAIFDALRPRAINLQIAIAPVAGTSTLYMFGRQSVWNTLDPKSAEIATEKLGVTPQHVEVPTYPLRDIIERHLAADDQFEVLSIDAEGYDIEILKTVDWNERKPRVVLIETHGFDPLHPSHAVCGYLTERGYKLYAFINPNLMFVREDSTV